MLSSKARLLVVQLNIVGCFVTNLAGPKTDLALHSLVPMLIEADRQEWQVRFLEPFLYMKEEPKLFFLYIEEL